MIASPIEHLPSLRRRLLWHVLLPLLLTWALGTVLIVGIANYFVARAFDRSILDDAYVIASNVGLHDGKLELQISPTELANLLFDQSEQIYFSVQTPNAQVIAGNAGLSASILPAGSAYAFSDGVQQGRAVRMVTLERNSPAKLIVIVAQTSSSRVVALKQLALYAALPQLILLALLTLWLRRAISADLNPLSELAREVMQRDARDLSPVQIQTRTRDLAHLSNTLNALFHRVDTGISAQREFAGNVAHELRTPLAGIRALANYGLARNEPLLWKQQLLEIASSEVRASHMIDQLLALALGHEMGQTLAFEKVRLDLLVRESVLSFMPQADALGIDLGAQGIDQAINVLGHEALIEGILRNLIENALRYAKPKNQQSAMITVAASAISTRKIKLSIIDNGQGIPMPELQKIQKRWQRGPGALELKQGTGLGLAIVAQYAQLLNVHLSMHPSGDPEGWIVELIFPAL